MGKCLLEKRKKILSETPGKKNDEVNDFMLKRMASEWTKSNVRQAVVERSTLDVRRIFQISPLEYSGIYYSS